MTLDEIMGLAPVIPVVVIEDAAHAVPLARALVAGGLPAIEVTLRTAAALEAIRRIAGEVECAVVGAGTILSGPQRQRAGEAGARFGVSPGLIPGEDQEGMMPLLPGVATAGELMAGMAAGFARFKFFPAMPMGGAETLKALHGPFPDVVFCPTGGVGPKSAPGLLALPNVACVGGSWMAPRDAIAAGDWPRIEALAREAAGLPR